MAPRIRHKPSVSLANYIRKHSPLKAGLKVKDEDAPLTDYTKIAPRIYLGNYRAAKDRDFFKRKNIKAVLNCTKDIPNYFESKDSSIEYLRIPVDDSLKERDFKLMFQFMPLISEYITKHVDILGNNIFIHCHAGRQRSAAAVAAYYIKKGMTPHDACELILSKRKEAFHFGESLNFDQALLKFYKSLKK
jgi:protein-tyrosine phosphatase